MRETGLWNSTLEAELVAAAAGLQARREAATEPMRLDGSTVGLDVDLDSATDQVIDLLFEMVFERRDHFIATRDLALASLRDPTLAAAASTGPSSQHRALERLLAEIGSTEPELDADLLATTLEGLGLAWLRHADDHEHAAKLGRSVRRLLEKFLRDKD